MRNLVICQGVFDLKKINFSLLNKVHYKCNFSSEIFIKVKKIKKRLITRKQTLKVS